MRRELGVRSVLCKAPEVPVFGKIGLTLSFPRNPYFPNCIFLKEATGFSQKGGEILTLLGEADFGVIGLQ